MAPRLHDQTSWAALCKLINPWEFIFSKLKVKVVSSQNCLRLHNYQVDLWFISSSKRSHRSVKHTCNLKCTHLQLKEWTRWPTERGISLRNPLRSLLVLTDGCWGSQGVVQIHSNLQLHATGWYGPLLSECEDESFVRAHLSDMCPVSMIIYKCLIWLRHVRDK